MKVKSGFQSPPLYRFCHVVFCSENLAASREKCKSVRKCIVNAMAALFLEKAHLREISCVETGSPSHYPLMPNDRRAFGLIWHCVGHTKGGF